MELTLKTPRNLEFISASPVDGGLGGWKRLVPSELASDPNSVTLQHQSGVEITFHRNTVDPAGVIVDEFTPTPADPRLKLIESCMVDWVARAVLVP